MKLPRREFLHLAAGAAALPAVSPVVWAQAYPSRPVRWIVAFAAGGPTDIVARIMGQHLSERLGQQFIIDNRPGAGGIVGTQAAINSPPDGYTILMAAHVHAINATLYQKLPYNFLNEIAPIAGLVRMPNVMEVTPSFPAKTVGEFIAYVTANPGKVSYASAGNGTSAHLAAELFRAMTGVDFVHVPYRGSGPALTDLLNGQVQVMFDTISSSIAHIQAGKLRALAVTSVTRSDSAARRADDCRDGAGLRAQRLVRRGVARVDEEAHALVPGSDAVYRFPSKSYGNVEGIAWLSRDTLVAVSDRKKRGQPARCAEKDQSIHLFRIPAG